MNQSLPFRFTALGLGRHTKHDKSTRRRLEPSSHPFKQRASRTTKGCSIRYGFSINDQQRHPHGLRPTREDRNGTSEGTAVVRMASQTTYLALFALPFSSSAWLATSTLPRQRHRSDPSCPPCRRTRQQKRTALLHRQKAVHGHPADHDTSTVREERVAPEGGWEKTAPTPRPRALMAFRAPTAIPIRGGTCPDLQTTPAKLSKIRRP